MFRLTRNSDDGGGHERALLFAELGGPAAILKLRVRHGFIGFASLATILLRHILEDAETMKAVMDKVRRHNVYFYYWYFRKATVI